MIIIKKNQDDTNTMTVSLEGNAEEVAQEYVALTLKLHDEYPIVLDRAQWYLDEYIRIKKRGNE